MYTLSTETIADNAGFWQGDVTIHTAQSSHVLLCEEHSCCPTAVQAHSNSPGMYGPMDKYLTTSDVSCINTFQQQKVTHSITTDGGPA